MKRKHILFKLRTIQSPSLSRRVTFSKRARRCCVIRSKQPRPLPLTLTWSVHALWRAPSGQVFFLSTYLNAGGMFLLQVHANHAENLTGLPRESLAKQTLSRSNEGTVHFVVDHSRGFFIYFEIAQHHTVHDSLEYKEERGK